MATKNATAKIKLQYFRSKICTPVKHKLVVKGLGFTRLNQIVEREDTHPSVAWSPRFPISSASSINCKSTRELARTGFSPAISGLDRHTKCESLDQRVHRR